MQVLSNDQFSLAARLFADGFAADPAFRFCLQDEADPKAVAYRFFWEYLSTCKELMLYTTSDAMEGVLCIYRWDKPPVDFACPSSLEQLERFQILDRHYHKDFAVLDIMAVDAACRGRGLAGKMIEFFVSYCRQQGLAPLTEIFGEAHLSLYQRHGFQVTHQQTTGGITTYVLEYTL